MILVRSKMVYALVRAILHAAGADLKLNANNLLCVRFQRRVSRRLLAMIHFF